MTTTIEPPIPAAVARRSAVLLPLLCVAQFMLLIDDTIVNVALPTIRGDLGFSEASLSWVVNAYFLTFGGLLLVGGRMADVVGRRRLFLVGIAVFGVASLGSGIAPTATTLVLARGLQGIGGALLAPSALSLVLNAYREPVERARALGAWASLTGVGAVTGLLAGGLIVEVASWRWVFLINLPIAVAALLAARRVVPSDEAAARHGAPDAAGAMLATAALVCLVFTVVETDRHGWGSARTVAGLVLAVALACGFVLRERRVAVPLIPVGLVRSRRVMAANALVLIGAAGLFAMFFFITLYMQGVRGWSPLRTGVSFLPFSLGFGVTSAVISARARANASRALLMVGSVIGAAGMWRMSLLAPTTAYGTGLFLDLLIVGVGLGLVFVPAVNAATSRSAEDDTGLASGLMTTCQQIGGAVGIAVLVTLASHVTADSLHAGAAPPEALVDGFGSAFHVQALLIAATVVLGAIVGGAPRASGLATRAPADVQEFDVHASP